ncbi:metalloregulator ArsR/SmtB family transcription factor [Cryobacterium sp. PAMC25264]|uniref:helix-turn-helix transcriptional regulator n=1 Tax=Cryobacterium sp. PAMC25264 TaxID=2861288 RepID=UPI001C627E5C|nr:helix-turn-helix domain-containing protein [Cryobacterium sp. PAMC25264]QYF75213.1 helix-turn-helix domain-containing protein [Cryobacterium sp. PAMC25264]
MVATTQNDARHTALASEPRRRALALITGSAEPMGVGAVAEALGLHITTARFHLEQLEAAGLVERQVARAGQRGRPQVLFSAVAAPLPVETAQQQLAQALAAVISEDDDGGRARSVRAGERWSAQYADVADAVAPDTLDAPVATVMPPLLRVLTEIGFEPEVRPDETTIALTACPFRAEARENPGVVCSVHLGLIKGLVTSLGHDAEGIRLEPFVQPTLCLVHLPATLAN